MALLSELQPAIAVALNSLGGKMTKGVEDLYYLYASGHINTAVDAFILLRREHRIDGARLLVRPAIEAMLRLQAVRVKTYLLYRVLLREALEADKWFGSVARRHGVAYTHVYDRDASGKPLKIAVLPSLAPISWRTFHLVLTTQPPRLALKPTTTAITAVIASIPTAPSKLLAVAWMN